jgi:hypothetical protein
VPVIELRRHRDAIFSRGVGFVRCPVPVEPPPFPPFSYRLIIPIILFELLNLIHLIEDFHLLIFAHLCRLILIEQK